MLPASLHPATWCLTNERLLPMKKLAIVSNQIGKMNVPMITWRPRRPRLKLKHSARFVFYIKMTVASGAQGKLLIDRMQNRKSKCSYDLNHRFESLQIAETPSRKSQNSLEENVKLIRWGLAWVTTSKPNVGEIYVKNNTKAKKKVELLNHDTLA